MTGEKQHVTKLSNGDGADQEKGCYFTIFNCDDHTCSYGNSQGCNNYIECGDMNTGGAEYDGVCKKKNYGDCISNITCRPSMNTGKGPAAEVDDIEAYIRERYGRH